MNCNFAKEVWDNLISLYDGDSKVKKAKLQTHRRQFESLKVDDDEDIVSYFLRVAKVVNSLKGLEENIEESIIVQKVLTSLPERFDSKVSSIEETKDQDTLKMDELHGILITYEMRKGCPSSKDATFKASKSKKGKEWNVNSDDSNAESELLQFLRRLKKGSKLKGFNKKNFFSKQDQSDEDEFVVIKKKSTNQFPHCKGGNEESNEENDHVGSQEVLFMAFTNDDDSGPEGNVDELLMRAIEENYKLQNKNISLKVENEETKIREDLLKNKLKETKEVCEEREAEIVSLRKELEQVKKGWESSQILDTILNNQKSQHDKYGIGFKGESSSTKNNAKSYADVLSSNPKE
eukprot:PITA_25126